MNPSNALILIDFQNDYFADGLWPVEDMDRVAASAAKALKAARRAGDFVIHIQHAATLATAPFFQPDTDGMQINAAVAPQQGEAVIIKHRPNSFQGTDLHAQLQTAEISKVTLVGAMTQMCIDATARAARDLGYDVTLVADACGAKAQTFGDVTLTATQVQAAFLGALAMSYATVI